MRLPQKDFSAIRLLFATNWLILVIAVTLLSTISSVMAPNAWSIISSNSAFYASVERTGLWINLIIYTLPIFMSAVLALYWPRRWRSTLLLIAILPLPLGAVTSGRVGALLTTLAILLPVCWGGREIVRRIVSTSDRATGWALGATLGIIALAMLGFIAGILGILRPLVFWPIFLSITLVLLASAARGRLFEDITAARVALRRPAKLTPARILMAGLLVATAWSVILGALAPEINSDTTRQRTVAALHFAQTRTLDVGDIASGVAAAPALGEITYAIVLALGPLPAAKLFALAIGGLCIALVALIARRLGGRRAELLAVLSFATMPLVVWLGQTAYLDLFTCLAALAAVLFLIQQRIPTAGAAFASGLCCGWGIGVKVHFGYVFAGITVALLLLALSTSGSQRERLRRTTLLALIFGSAVVALLAAPFDRSIILTGQVPGLSLATQSFVRADGTSPSVLADLPRFGYGRDLFHLIILPLDLTLHSAQFEWTLTPWGPFNGLLGYLPLALIPLLALIRSERRTTALWCGAAVSGLGWFFSAQYLRYGLPIVALLCPIGAAAFVRLCRSGTIPKQRQLLMSLVVVPLLAGVIVQARVPEYKHSFVLGQQSEASYLNHFLICCGGTAVLELLDEQPDAIRALTLNEIPRIYAHTPVGTTLVSTNGQPLPDKADPLTTLAALDAGGYSHLIITRRYLSTGWEDSQLIDETFLRRYTVLVGNNSDTYLYRILPPSERTASAVWTKGTELLTNGDFETTDTSGGPANWIAVHEDGTVSSALIRYARGAMAASGLGAVETASGEGWQTVVPVQAGQRYLIKTASRNAAAIQHGDSGLTIRLEWRDAHGRTLASSFSRVPTSSSYHSFSVAATAPAGTAVVAVMLFATNDTNILVDDVSLKEVIGGVDLEAIP